MKCACAVMILLASLMAAVVAAADAPPTKTGGDGWISLFDGQSLKGWKASEHPEQWKVEDGKIVASGPRSHLFYIGDDERPSGRVPELRFQGRRDDHARAATRAFTFTPAFRRAAGRKSASRPR